MTNTSFQAPSGATTPDASASPTSHTPLFRPEVQATRDARDGHPLPWNLPHIDIWSGGLLILLVFAVFALLQLDYADKLSVDGIVQPTVRPAGVVSGATGIVQHVHVRERQYVQAGEALALIDKRSHGADGASQVQLQVNQLVARRQTVDQARASYQALRIQQRQVLENRLKGLDARHQTMMQRIAVLQQRVALAKVNQRKVLGLAAKGWLSDSDVHRSQSAMLLEREHVLDQQERLHSVLAERGQTNASLSVFAEETLVRLAEFDADARQIGHEIGKVTASGEALVLAPITGRIVDLVAHAGKQVSPGMSLLTISPDHADLHHVEAYLPSHAAGRVRTGMSVRLRYSGYPFQEFGTGLGQIASVSEVNYEAGVQPLFRAEIKVLELPQDIDHTPAGMSVNADILLASRPLWDWLSKPVAAAFASL